MIDAEPKVGWVLRYNYLWSEADTHSLAGKDRPVVVVLAIKRAEGRVLVRVAPITRRDPGDAARAVEIPAVTKARLGLDHARSWIVLDHANEFIWPGPDLRPTPGKHALTVYYGPLPPKLFDAVRRRLLSLISPHRQTAVFRPD